MRKSIQSLLALSVSLAFSGVALANDVATSTQNTNTNVSPVVISEKAPVEENKKENKKEEKKPTFVISKGSAYQQLSYDLRKQGYRLQWQLRNDAPLKVESKKFDTWQDKTLDIVDQLNATFFTGSDDGSIVKAFVCPQLSYVVIAPERSAGMVVDKDGRGCNLLSKAPEDPKNNSVLNNFVSSAVAVPSVAVPTVAIEQPTQTSSSNELPTVSFER